MNGFDLPITITVNDKSYPIRNRGDFRVILDCFEAINDPELGDTLSAITALIIFLDGMETEEDIIDTFGNHLGEALTQMYLFFNCGQESIGAVTKYDVVDWEADAQLISGAINAIAGFEIRGIEYLHWWSFMGYYLNIGECAFSTIVNIRSKIRDDKKLEKYEKDFKRDNPQYFVVRKKPTAEEKSFEDELRKGWD